jgi:DNA polymerase III epsilon subunit-like protein
VHTDETISEFITSLTGITQADVAGAPTFATLAVDLQRTIRAHCSAHAVRNCFWVAHNGFRFDQPILSRYLQSLRSSSQCLQSVGDSVRFWCVDTYRLSLEYSYTLHHPGTAPVNHKLPTLHAFFRAAANTPTDVQFHRANEDVRAMVEVFLSMERHDPDLLFGHVSYDTYFMDKMSPQRMVNRVSFDALQGVHGQPIRWTAQQQTILGAPFDQHMCIVAGAGCAKTTTLLGRILCLLRSGVPPQRIMLVTFSKDATDDMVARLAQWVGTEVPIITGTFDALARRYVKENDEVAFDACQDVGDYKLAFLQFLQTSRSPHRSSVLSSIDYMLVDEYQDINSTYHDIIQTFAHHGTRVTAVGDDAQNIYTWNGSDIQYILEFGTTFHTCDTNEADVPVETYYLTHNFRSTPEIIQLANAIIARNIRQLPKTIEATRPSVNMPVTVCVHQSWAQEAHAILPMVSEALNAGKTVALLCRNCTNNGPLFFYESQCVANNIPCTLLERYRDHRNHRTNRAVTLCTIHKSKGLEWDVVFVVGCTDGHFPNSTDTDTHALDEERRLFYVATTRAKSRLVFTASHSSSDTTTTTRPSQFLTEVPRSLFVWSGKFVCADAHRPSSDTGTRCVPLERELGCINDTQWEVLRSVVGKLECVCVDVHPAVELPDWVRSEHSHADIERWYVHLLALMHGTPRIRALEQMQTTVMATNREYNVYLLYKQTFDTFCKTGKMRPHNLEPEHLSTFNRLFVKCEEKARQCAVETKDVYVSPRTNIPNSIRQRIVASYKQYTTSTQPWSELLWEAFEVSWYEALERGRMRMVHQHILEGKEKLQDCRPLVDTMHRVFFEDNTPSTHACENNVARLFRDATSVQLQATAVFDGLSVHVPLLVQKKLFVVSLAESTRATAHECMGWMLQVLVCRQSGVLVDAVHTYYPHKGVVNVLDLSSWSNERLEKVWGAWTCVRNAEGGAWNELVVSVRNGGHAVSGDGENKADGVGEFVVDTETWENCVVEDMYSNVAS